MVAEPQYGIVLWAIPRFRRAELEPRTLIAKAFQPQPGAEKTLAGAPSTSKPTDSDACMRFYH